MDIVLPINYVTFIMLLTIFSFASLFFGAKLFKIILAIVGVFVGVFIISPIIANHTTNNSVIFLGGVASGIVLALVSIFFFYGGIAIIGIFLSFMILKLLNIEVAKMNQFVSIIIITVLTIIFILVADNFAEVIITSAIGGILLSNCLYFFYIHFIKENKIDFNKYISLIKSDSITYFTLLGISLFLTIIGIIFQFKNNKSRS